MSNRTYVCFTCRTTDRVPIARITRRCRKCHEPAEHVYYKFRIPKADDDKGWSELEEKVRAVNRQIKVNWLRHLRAQAERYERALASPPSRRKAAEARLREVLEKIGAIEQWKW